MVQRGQMPTFRVATPQQSYDAIVERGILNRASEFIPAKAGKLFVVTTEDVWKLFHELIKEQFPGARVLFFPGGEANKRLSQVERLADQMLVNGADRGSVVIGFGGGIVTDISGFLAAVFMRGVPVLQIPTTLLAQVDAAVGGKTGVNLVGGKNLVGSFHQPLAVLIDPQVVRTLPEREYRAGLFEVIKCGIICDPQLFRRMADSSREILAMKPDLLDELIAAAVRIKAEVVSADEREGDLRRILNFGHTVGHAIEAETSYTRLLHGEAVAWGMIVAARLAELIEMLSPGEAAEINAAIKQYGPLPRVDDLSVESLISRLASDKKTLGGIVHFVLPTAIGSVKVVTGIEKGAVRRAINEGLAA